MTLRWGIIAAGNISNDFVNSLGILSSYTHKIVAIASSNEKKSKEFAEKYGIKKYYEGYDKLAKDSNVDIAYIGIVNRKHYEIAMMMLNNGKHVLCEKPMCMNENQTQKLISHAKTKNLFIMEAIWSRFFPSYQYVQNLIDKNVLGEIKEIEVSLGYPMMEYERINKKEIGGGTILDLGVYTIQFCLLIFKEMPISIKASITGQLNDDGLDTGVEVDMIFSNSRKSKMRTSSLNFLENTAKIIGTKGEITLHDFWCCTKVTNLDKTEKFWTLPKTKFDMIYMNGAGLHYEAEKIRKCIYNNQIECEQMNHLDSLNIAHIQDEIRKQIGVTFEEDCNNY